MILDDKKDFDGFGHKLSLVDLLRLSFRVFRTKPIRTFLTITGMSVGIGTVVILISLGYGLQYILIGKLVTTEDSLITLGVAYPQEANLNIDLAKLEDLRKLPDATELVPVGEFSAEARNASTTGLIIAKITNPDYFRLSGTLPDIGSQFEIGTPGVVLSAQAVKIIGLSPNKSALGKEISFNIFYQEGQNSSQQTESPISTTKPLVITGIISDEQPPYAIIPQDFVSKAPPFYKEALIKAKNIDSVEKLRDKITEKGFVGLARLDLVQQARKVMNIITSILGVFGIAALVVSAIGMFNTMIVGFLERIYEVGIMKSIGASDRDVRNLFLTESFLMGFLGGAGGIAIGVGGGQILNILISVFAQHFGGKAFDLFITPLWFILVTLVLSTFIGLVAGFWPAHRSSGLSPKEAFRSK